MKRRRKKARVDCFHFAQTESDPIIENLREVFAKQKTIRNIDHEILDQVALEGLTGITLSRLCLIIDAIIPSVNSCNHDGAQDYIWSVIVNGYMRRVPGARIQVFHLDLSNRKKVARASSPEEIEQNKNFCIDKAIKLPIQSLKRIAKSDWMLQPVLDGQIMGSCPDYEKRQNISQEVIELYDKNGPRESLLDIHTKYDLKYIYFVADQEVRRNALLPKSFDPNTDIKLREYACLELIGRTRCFGIVFPNDKTLGRYRILLTAKGLITQYQQTCNTYIVHHLRRFSKYNIEFGTKAFKGGLDGLIREKVSYGADEDDDDEVFEGDEDATVKGTCCQPARLKSDRDILKMVYDVIALSKGRSMCDIRRKLKLPKSHIRNHLKNLASTQLIGSHTRLIGDKKTRIYRARHYSTRRKIARQRKLLRGVKAKWDETDLRAKELLGLKRSHFTQAEDSLITLCRITGLLMDAKYAKSFIIPKRAIRDILHDELIESHDKTSDALLRRVQYLRRLPSNVSLINEITAELRDDSDIKRMIETNKETIGRSDEKLVAFFKQLLRSIRSKLPHLLGLTSSLVTNSSIDVKDYEDLTQRFELIDCRDAYGKRDYHQPLWTPIQLVKSTPNCYRLKITKCEDMQTVMLVTSWCAQSYFNLKVKLKVPVRVVSLDQDNESFKDIFEKAKESKEASRVIANLTSPNPTADSRRALFMLRNALKLQTIDKCGKLADALIIQPCDIEFSSEEEITFDAKDVLIKFLDTSKFSSEIKEERKNSNRESLNQKRREKDRRDRKGLRGGVPTKQEKLFRMIEAIMSWVGTYPGIELESLQKYLAPQLGANTIEHLNELLELMDSLELISRDCTPDSCLRPCLFGYRKLNEEETKPIVSLKPRDNAYVRLCQLIDVVEL